MGSQRNKQQQHTLSALFLYPCPIPLVHPTLNPIYPSIQQELSVLLRQLKSWGHRALILTQMPCLLESQVRMPAFASSALPPFSPNPDPPTCLASPGASHPSEAAQVRGAPCAHLHADDTDAGRVGVVPGTARPHVHAPGRDNQAGAEAAVNPSIQHQPQGAFSAYVRLYGVFLFFSVFNASWDGCYHTMPAPTATVCSGSNGMLCSRCSHGFKD